MILKRICTIPVRIVALADNMLTDISSAEDNLHSSQAICQNCNQFKAFR